VSASEVLVTGGSGVLGQQVVERLGSAGIEARVLSRSGRSGTVRGDLTTGEGLDLVVRGAETIIHCASSLSARPARQTSKGQSACSKLLPQQASRTSSTSPSSA
jgi:nucleoside-diphosphate-sugar epimerase